MKKLTERPTDYDIDFEYDAEPVLIRIRNLAPRRRELFDQWYTANVRGEHKIRSLDWETVTAVSKALTAYESDAALGDGDNAHRADTELMMPLAARMAELEPGTRMLVLDLFANYGVQYEDPQQLTTVGQVDC